MLIPALLLALVAETTQDRQRRGRVQEVSGRLGLGRRVLRPTGLQGHLLSGIRRALNRAGPEHTLTGIEVGLRNGYRLVPRPASGWLSSARDAISHLVLDRTGEFARKAQDAVETIKQIDPDISTGADQFIEWLIVASADHARRVNDLVRRNAVRGPYDSTDLFYEHRTIRQIWDWANQANPNLSQYSLAEAHEASDDWHNISHITFGKPVPDAVPLLRYKSGWSIQRLVTRAHFRDEGNSMGHCIGGGAGADGGSRYYQQSRDGTAAAYSIRNPYGVPVATFWVEIHGEPSPDDLEQDYEITIAEIEGPGNNELEEQTVDQAIAYQLTELLLDDTGAGLNPFEAHDHELDSLSLPQTIEEDELSSLEETYLGWVAANGGRSIEAADERIEELKEQVEFADDMEEAQAALAELESAISAADEPRRELLVSLERLLREYLAVPTCAASLGLVYPLLADPIEIDGGPMDGAETSGLINGVGFRMLIDTREGEQYLEGRVMLHLGDSRLVWTFWDPEDRGGSSYHHESDTGVEDETYSPQGIFEHYSAWGPTVEDVRYEFSQVAPRWDRIITEMHEGETSGWLLGAGHQLEELPGEATNEWLSRLLRMPTPVFLHVLDLHPVRGRLQPRSRR